MSNGPGIDWGRVAQTNRNKETGIHYGVISQNDMGQAWSDSSEPDYGPPACPVCGGSLANDGDFEEFARYRESGCADYACTSCELTLDSSDCFPEEAFAFTYEKEGYKLTSSLETNIFVLDSPYFTYAVFCSPCVPGAGDLNNHRDNETDGVPTYCLGHDWFDEGRAPYPVYSVNTKELVV